MNEVKLNIITNKAEFLNGYINLSPKLTDNNEVCVGDIKNLDWILDNGECSEIIALDSIEYFSYKDFYNIIPNWIAKLRVGGKLILGFIETESLCNLYNRGMISHDNFNTLLHGDLLTKLSSYSAPLLIEELSKRHTVKLIRHTLNGVDCTLTFSRFK